MIRAGLVMIECHTHTLVPTHTHQHMCSHTHTIQMTSTQTDTINIYKHAGYKTKNSNQCMWFSQPVKKKKKKLKNEMKSAFFFWHTQLHTHEQKRGIIKIEHLTKQPVGFGYWEYKVCTHGTDKSNLHTCDNPTLMNEHTKRRVWKKT